MIISSYFPIRYNRCPSFPRYLVDAFDVSNHVAVGNKLHAWFQHIYSNIGPPALGGGHILL
jgi:hypothetical protein